MNYRNPVPGRPIMDHIDATQRLTRTNNNNVVRGQLTDGGLNLPTTQSLHYDAPWCHGNTNDLQRSTLHHRDATYRPQTDAAPRHSADQIQQHPNAVGFNDRNRWTAPNTHTTRSYKTASEQSMDGHYSDVLRQGLPNSMDNSAAYGWPHAQDAPYYNGPRSAQSQHFHWKINGDRSSTGHCPPPPPSSVQHYPLLPRYHNHASPHPNACPVPTMMMQSGMYSDYQSTNEPPTY